MTSNKELDFDFIEVSQNGLYRPCVGAVILQNDLILCGTRIDNSSTTHSQTIQMPQGGVEKDENLYDAIIREIFEEIGIIEANLKFLTRTKEWLYYDIPQEFHGRLNFQGQAQIWYMFHFHGTDEDINLHASSHPEFSQYFWKKPQEIIENGIYFKKALYHKLFSTLNILDI